MTILVAFLLIAAPVRGEDATTGSMATTANTTGAPTYHPDSPGRACFLYIEDGAAGTGLHDTFDLSLNGLTLRDALSFLLQGTDYRLVGEELLDVPATGSLDAVTWPDALDVLAQRHDLGIEIESNRVRVAPTETRSFRINHVGDPENVLWTDLEEDVVTLLSDQGRAVASPRIGLLTVIDRPSAVRRVESFVRELERTLRQQVDIQARIIEISLDETFQMGVDWNVLAYGWDGIRGNTDGGGLLELQTVTGGGVFQMGLVDTERLETLFEFLEQHGNLRVISRPRVASMANEPAVFRMTDNVPYYSIEVISADGSDPYVQYDVDFKEAGVLLEVTPQVGDDERIILNVKPSVSSVTGFTESLPNLPPQPIIDVRETETSVRLAEGQTLILGGLIETLEQERTRGVPVLSRIPVLGALFRSTSIIEDKRELVVLLTPRLVRDARTDLVRNRSAALPVAPPEPRNDGPYVLAAHRHRQSMRALAGGDLRQAVELAREAVRHDPRTDAWKLNLAYLLAQDGRFEEAERTWLQLRKASEPIAEWAELNLRALRSLEATVPAGGAEFAEMDSLGAAYAASPRGFGNAVARLDESDDEPMEAGSRITEHGNAAAALAFNEAARLQRQGDGERALELLREAESVVTSAEGRRLLELQRTAIEREGARRTAEGGASESPASSD